VIDKQDLVAFEARIAARFDEGEFPYLIHLSGGNEDELIEIFKEIDEADYVFSTHRNHCHYLLHGGSPDELERKILTGKSMFIFDRAMNFFSSSIVAATPAIAAGVAWALKRKKSQRKVWCFVGDGAEDEGHFYEAARYVDGWNLPCRFVIEDNDRNVSASKKERRGNNDGFPWPPCVRRYEYKASYPHSGSGTSGWLRFKREAEIVRPPKRLPSFPLLGSFFSAEAKYFDAVKQSNEMLATECGAIFVGYNVRHGSAYGALKDVPEDQRLEAPLAENLMMGLAMGMSLEGLRPVVFFERHEFLMNAMDAIVNTLDVVETISGGEFKMPVIMKAVAGGARPFYAGLTHTRNLAAAVRGFVSFPVYEPQTGPEVLAAYDLAKRIEGPVMISERKELY
jgi:hypothetical protein